MTEVIYMFKQVIVINSNKRTGKKFNLDNIKFIYYKGLCVSITFYIKKWSYNCCLFKSRTDFRTTFSSVVVFRNGLLKLSKTRDFAIELLGFVCAALHPLDFSLK